MAQSLAIETSDLTKFYGRNRGIEALNLKVEKGEIFGFLGPNGAGKTTTIRLLLNLIFPTRGTARIFGRDVVSESKEVRKLVGYISSDVRLYPRMKVAEFLDFIASISQRKPVLRDEILSRFPVPMNARINQLSMGNKRKVAIVAAFQCNPEVLILDEPTLGLDPLMQRQFYELLESFRSQGKTVFLSSHNLPEVEKVCDRVALIRDGFLVSLEKVEDLTVKKIKYVELELKQPLPEGFSLQNAEIVTRTDNSLQLKVKGEIGPLLKELASLPVRDMTVVPASLEDVFLEFYQPEEVS